MGYYRWSGWYAQQGREFAMSFEAVEIAAGAVVARGRDAVGEFRLSGSVQGAQVRLVKQYAGKHAVDYEGEFRDGAVRGRWRVGGLSDEFFIVSTPMDRWLGQLLEAGADAQPLELHFKPGEDAETVRGLGALGPLSCEITGSFYSNAESRAFNFRLVGPCDGSGQGTPLRLTLCGVVGLQQGRPVATGGWTGAQGRVGFFFAACSGADAQQQ